MWLIYVLNYTYWVPVPNQTPYQVLKIMVIITITKITTENTFIALSTYQVLFSKLDMYKFIHLHISHIKKILSLSLFYIGGNWGRERFKKFAHGHTAGEMRSQNSNADRSGAVCHRGLSLGKCGHVVESVYLWNTYNELSIRKFPGICQTSATCNVKGSKQLCVSASFIPVPTPPCSGPVHLSGSASSRLLQPSAGWSIHLSGCLFQHHWRTGTGQGCSTLPFAPAAQPNQTPSSWFPCLFVELPVEVTWAPDVRLAFDSWSCLFRHFCAIKSRFCSLRFSLPLSFMFFITPPPESTPLLVISSLNSGPCLRSFLLSQPRQIIFT